MSYIVCDAVDAKTSQPFLDSCDVVLGLGITHATMQGMDIDANGSYYISWEENKNMHIRKFGQDESQMILPTGGHGDCFTIEQKRDSSVYFWTSGSLGESCGGFRGGKALDESVRLICRYRYEPYTTKYPEDAEACYYINDNGCRMVDIDEKNNHFVCWTSVNDSDLIVVYRLSDLSRCKNKEIPITRSYHKDRVTEVFDLNSITPLSRFVWDRKYVCGQIGEYPKAVQGFCVDNGKIYVLMGYKNDRAATFSVLDLSGKILGLQREIHFTADKKMLIKRNLSSDGTFEPEGIHIRNGYIYIGFVGDYPEKGASKHSSIVRFKF